MHDTPLHPSPSTPSHLTLAYGPEPEQVGDLYLPEPAHDTPPVVMLIHGGFWRSYWRRDLLQPLAEDLRAAGAVVWNVEYRRGGAGGGPLGMLRDIAHALDVIDLAGARHGFDPASVVIVGHSAGGHLAAWVASGARDEHPGIHPRVVQPAQLVALAPVLDLVEAERRALGNHATAEFVGARLEEHPEVFEQYSPAHHLPLGAAMTIVHGTHDDRVPHDMSVTYANTAQAAGDQVTMLSIEGADHFDVINPTSTAWQAARPACLHPH